METKTYYMLLGISSSESPRGIRAAYRELAKKLHPDVAGEQATRAFQEVSEAYRVLSDPQLRRRYNDKLKAAAAGEIVTIRHAPEPTVRDLTSIRASAESIRPSFEAAYERFLRNFTGIGIPKSERLEALTFQVLLSPEESARGCVVPLGVPVFSRCPQCDGSGVTWLRPCYYCLQQGIIEDEETIQVQIPPMYPSGSFIEIPLHGLGIHNFYLRLHVLVEGRP